MIAGPNGAGKTTMALELIKDTTEFFEYLNADEIAKGLAPLHPESVALSASKLMIKRLKELVDAERSFVFETTASGVVYASYLKEAKQRGYEINVVYLWLASSEEAIKRVAQRVMQGGHHVPDEVVVRRYHAGLKNLVKLYVPLADSVIIFDNSGSIDAQSKLIFERNKDNVSQIVDSNIWGKIVRDLHG